MRYIGSQKRYLTLFKILLVVSLILLVAETSTHVEIPAGQDTQVSISSSYLFLNASNIQLGPGYGEVSIIIFDTSNNTIEIIYNRSPRVAYTTINVYNVNSSYYSDIFAGISSFEISNGAITTYGGYYSWPTQVNLTNATAIIVWDGDTGGYLSLSVVPPGQEPGNEWGGIEIPDYRKGLPSPSFIDELIGFLKAIFIGLITYIKIVAGVVEIVWEVIIFVFQYVNIVLAIVKQYVLPNLVLFLGIYFFGTLGVAIAEFPRRGFKALVDWGELWYGHIMALVKFIEKLAEWSWKIIEKVLNFFDSLLGGLLPGG